MFYKYNVQKNIEWHFVILLVNNKLINSKIMDFLMVGGIGTSEIMLIVFALLLLFGGKKLPELMRGMGRGIREFKDAVNTSSQEDGSSSQDTK